MKDLYPGADWRPLGNPADEPPIGIPKGLYWHTMVGFLLSTERYFKDRNGQGYDGTESTWGIGGPFDPKGYDGKVFQWQRASRQADAQGAGNAFLNSIECSDGGNPDRPLSPAQVEASIDLGHWWCLETGRPAREMDFPGDVGFGYHSLFKAFNPNGHTCPNPTRIAQLRKEIWPEIALRLRGTDVDPKPKPPVSPPPATVAPRFPLPQGWYFGPKEGPKQSVSGYYHRMSDGRPGHPGLLVAQKQFKARGWIGVKADGLWDKDFERTVRLFQEEKDLGKDGRLGLQTWNALWLKPVT